MYDVDAVGAQSATPALVELDDEHLLGLVRSGAHEAYAVLYNRYRYATLRLARHLGQRDEADDVVAESFAQILALLNRGKGPDRAFRAYLFTTVRHECGRRAKLRQRVLSSEDPEQKGTPLVAAHESLDVFERSIVRAAYESLPIRWRTVLWHLDVEGRKPQDLGPLFDLTPNGVSALVYRARSGLRGAYLQQHLSPSGRSGCNVYRSKLSAYVRRTAGTGEREKIRAHLRICDECVAAYLDLQEVNREVGAS
jgi:RNA polymerase sigma factor (sigma-70 family)